MKLSTVEFARLHFPSTEWRWLRPAVSVSPLAERAPESFVWAARVEGALWAWHPTGAALEGPNADTRINVLELETDGTELEAHGLFLKTVSAVQPAQDIEWVAALQTLEGRLNYQITERGLPQHWDAALASCGLEAHLGALAQRRRFAFLNEAEERLVYEKRWEPAALELLESVPTEIRAAFVTAIRKWNLTAGQSREALSAALLLTKKMGDKAALNVLGGAFKNAEEFRTALFRTSQPELATLSQKRIEMLRDLKVPPRCAVFGDPSFESDILKITHTPRKPIDFERFKHWVAEPETAEKIRALLEIYQ